VGYSTDDERYSDLSRQYRAVRRSRSTRVTPDEPNAKLIRLRAALDLIEPGLWTSYGDLATLTGLANQKVGTVMAQTSHPAAYRVLQADGTVADGFRWTDPSRTDDPAELLRAEGIEFDDHGRA